MRTKLSFVVAALLAAACQDRHLPTSPPSFEISDAAHNAAVHGFFWLPPMVPDPTFTGAFNGNLSPTVRIDELPDETPDPDCGRLVTTFTMTTEPGSETIRVNTTDEYYIVNWHAGDAEFAIRTDCHYRISASVEFSGLTLVLGIADVDVVSNGKELKNVETGQYIGLVDGRTLPIKFRAEQVMSVGNVPGLCTLGLDCVVGVVGDEGGTVITPDEQAGVFVPDAALPSSADPDAGDTRLIVIEERPETPCFPAQFMGLPQFDECYRIESFPSNVYGDGDVTTLDDNITVGICVEAAGMSESQLLQLQVYRFDPNTNVVQALQNVSAAFLECEETRLDQNGDEIGSRSWPSLLDRLAALLGPRPLHAASAAVVVDFGVGGSSTETSFFTWSIPAVMSANSPQEQSAAPGAAVPVPPSVIVMDLGGPGDLEPDPVQGVSVTFTVASGSGTINGGATPVTVITGADGVASLTSWILPAAAGGPYTVTASAPGVGGSPVTFTATAGQPDLIVEALTHSPQDPNTLDLITFTAVVKNVGTASAGASTLEFRIGGETPGTAQTRFAVSALEAGQSFTVQRELTLDVAQNYRNTATADVDNDVAESDETNNVRTEDYTVTEPPDLIVESLTHDPENPTTVDLITFTAVVKNIGVGPARTSTLEFRIGGETPGTPQTRFPIPTLGPGESFTVQRQMVLSVAQNYINTAIADVDNAVAESNEGNNQRQDFYTVALRVSVHSLSRDVAAGNTGVLEQACPAGTNPTGGGFHFPRSNLMSGPDVIVIESSPRVTVTGTTGWRVVANNRTGDIQPMEVWVVCAAGLSGYDLSFRFDDVAAGSTGVLERACPAGTNPTGGGFHFPNSNALEGPDVIVIESSPRVTVEGTTGWRVAANNRTDVTQRMEVWVACAANLSGYAVLSFGQDVAAGNTGVLERACTAGKNPTGGGFHFPRSNLMSGPDVIVIESSPRVTAEGTTGWRVVANNRTGDIQPMEVWVGCVVSSRAPVVE